MTESEQRAVHLDAARKRLDEVRFLLHAEQTTWGTRMLMDALHDKEAELMALMELKPSHI